MTKKDDAHNMLWESGKVEQPHSKKEEKSLANEWKLLIAVIGIYSCYIVYGIYQEALYHFRSKEGKKFTATFFFLLVQCLTNVLVAGVAMLIWGGSKRRPPTMSFVVVGFSYIGAMLFSNEALKYVSYPTQALGKSCKMIPVMLFGFLIRGKKYTLIETLAVLFITAGINIFQSGKSGGESSIYGLVLLFLSLVLDGVTGASQDKLQDSFSLTTHELMFYLNFWAVVLLTVLSVATGQGIEGINYCVSNPEVVHFLVIASITSAGGQNFIFYTISNFNSLVLATITTTRKFFTILVSVFFFGHELKSSQWYGVAMVFLGLLLELVEKYRHKGKGKGGKKSHGDSHAATTTATPETKKGQ